MNKAIIINSIIVMFSVLSFAQANDNYEIKKAMEDVKKVDSDKLDSLLSESSKKEESSNSKPLPKTEEKIEKQVKAATKKSPMTLTAEESELLKKKFKPLKENPELMKEIEEEQKTSPIYSPAPTRDKSDDGLVVDRDSTKVVTKKISVNDSINLKICFNAGVQITLDEDISTELQTILLDDKIFFDAVPFENNRGAYVRLKQPVPDNSYWESSIRFIRKADDKSYLINLFALPCPKGSYPFPKVVYLKEKFSVLNKNSKVLTPEDTIISMSEGLPRVQKNRIRVYDMVASSGSDWVVFGVELQLPNRKTKDFDNNFSKYFKFLDNLQINQVENKIEYLSLQSEKATKAREIPTMRFKMMVKIDKNYILNNRYLHMMYVDKEEGHYQYVRIDTLPYFLSLKKRGFEL